MPLTVLGTFTRALTALECTDRKLARLDIGAAYMTKMAKLLFGITLFSALFAMGNAMAEEWVASKLRGGVFVYENGEWQQIFRGHVVDSGNAIQTSPRARVIFTRGKESIDVRGDTRIRIKDRVGQLNTVVEQDFGEITVDLEKQNVQHFAVKAPLLTAVVKGTKFTVKAEKNGAAAEVQVQRGRVEVQDVERKVKVDVKPGQKAARQAGVDHVIEVDGRGPVEPMISMNTNKPIAANSAELKAKLGLANKPAQAPGQQKKNDVVGITSGNSGISNAGGNSGNSGNSNSGSGGNSSGSSGNSNAGGNGNGNGNAGGNGKGKGR